MTAGEIGRRGPTQWVTPPTGGYCRFESCAVNMALTTIRKRAIRAELLRELAESTFVMESATDQDLSREERLYQEKCRRELYVSLNDRASMLEERNNAAITKACK